jgi:threonine dehydrogenase-like Zn-dependent dehydrogenase
MAERMRPIRGATRWSASAWLACAARTSPPFGASRRRSVDAAAMITHHVAFDQVPEALRMLDRGEPAVKVVVVP